MAASQKTSRSEVAPEAANDRWGDPQNMVNALDRVQAIIEFDLKGNVVSANDNFLNTLGYSIEEIQGKHHRMFCEKEYARSTAYRQFWKNLQDGECVQGDFKRLAKDGREVWINASYSPIFDEEKLTGFIKFATDITEQQRLHASMESKLRAVENAQAMIEFDLKGNIVHANENFLATTGYKLDEIVGNHHRIFCSEAYIASADYQQFWQDLGSGVTRAGVFKRFTKDGSEIRINASYNPMLDADGKQYGVVKFATDVTDAELLAAKHQSKLAAIETTQARIEFDLSGNILEANDNFLGVTGYELDEIVGKHHRMFCDAKYAASDEYTAFWEQLGAGKSHSGLFKRHAKSGDVIWINATYNPILNPEGEVIRVVKYATDATENTEKNAAYEGKVASIERSQAVIEFDLKGRILSANKNFLDVTGYTLEEIAGKHHRIFCEEAYTKSAEYEDFWEALRDGKFQSGEFKRLNKSGEEIWINASYNPIFNADGEISSYIKFATDITATKQRSADNEGKIAAIDRSQAVIEFDLDGNVLTANDLFLEELKYRLSDIVGKHHSMFCEADYVTSPLYKQFWEKLRAGEFDSGRYKRLAKDGSEVWISASYNPIYNADGKLYKVVKFASNVTSQVEVEADVRRLAQEFQDASTNIAKRSDNVAQTATILGENTEEMNAAVEELTASIDSIASNSKNADHLAKNTQKAAEVGSTAINDSIEAMGLINKSSEDIGEIVKVISEIASQTNLLALNAAIEAARAGEHGLGFSVVADEVRKLAERSSQATKEISQLINESVKRVNQGSETSKEAVKSFKQIVSGVHETTQAIAEISCAAEEQLVAAREVSASIQHISEASDKSASASTSIAEATSNLSEGARQLSESAQKFSV